MTTPTDLRGAIADLRALLEKWRTAGPGSDECMDAADDIDSVLLDDSGAALAALLAEAERAGAASPLGPSFERIEELKADQRKLDAVVHALGIEDSEADPAEVITATLAEREALQARCAGLMLREDAQAEEIARLRTRGPTLEEFITDLMQFQLDTFGPMQTIAGVLDHVTKELEKEIRPAPTDNKEWLGLMNLSVSAQRINGARPSEVVTGWIRLLDELKARKWPDWRDADPDKAIEHDRVTPSPDRAQDGGATRADLAQVQDGATRRAQGGDHHE